MGLIEQAAKRLEELRRAGIRVPASAMRPPASANDAAPAAPPEDEAPAAPVEETAPPVVSSIVPRAAPHSVAPQPQPVAPQPVGPQPAGPVHKIDVKRLADEGFVTPDMPRSRIADEFRILKRPLIANATTKGPTAIRHANLIMVTSAVPGEGKTFTSVNLAMSIAMELDRTVLL